MLKDPQGRRRLAQAVQTRTASKLPNPDIVIRGSTWTSRPTKRSAAWEPLRKGATSIYLETTPTSELRQIPSQRMELTTEALDIAREVIGDSHDLRWEYPPGVDAWDLASLLQSLTTPLPHVWARADQSAIVVGVDPYGGGGILLGRMFPAARSLVVLSAASSVVGHMNEALQCADSLILHESARGDLLTEGHPHLSFFETSADLESRLRSALADLRDTTPDPLVAFRGGSSVGGELANRAGDVEVVVGVAGDWGLRSWDCPQPTFASLFEHNIESFHIVGARLSLISRFRSLVDAGDDLRFLRHMLSEGRRIVAV